MFRNLRSTVIVGALLISAGTTVFAADSPAYPEQAGVDAIKQREELQKQREEMRKQMEAARQRVEQAAREVAELSARLAAGRIPDTTLFLSRNPNRAMLGVVIDAKDKATDDGASVLSVSPGGPAAAAGIKPGDIVVELNGKSLKGDRENRPSEKLLKEMAELTPGSEVMLRYRRDGAIANVKLKIESLPRVAQLQRFNFHFEPGDLPHFDDSEFDSLRNAWGLHSGPFGDLELIPLTPKLGQYFGTDKGLLVVRVPTDANLKLEEGDVLIDIDGRAPANPGHAFRILNSYQPSEKVTLNILRQRKKIAVVLTIPGRTDRGPHSTLPVVPPPSPPSALQSKLNEIESFRRRRDDCALQAGRYATS